MHIVVIANSVLSIGYALLMLAYRYGWRQQKEFLAPADYKPHTFISVIIPARNEAVNITACLNAILAQHYPGELFETIVVDDHSEDNTAAVVLAYASLNVRCIGLAGHLATGRKIVAYKKAALAAGIAQAKGDLIVTTDADCIAGKDWLRTLACIYEQGQPAMIVAPVIYNSNDNLVETFQLIDFMSMQGITAAAHSLRLGNMSNGANLAFSRAAFERVDGYKGIDHMASGDDLLLMTKISRDAGSRVAYVKSRDAIVATQPQPDWRNFIRQRIRWASKSGKYDDSRLTLILAWVYLHNLSFFVAGVWCCFHPSLLWWLAGMLTLKILIELFFLAPVARFFGKTSALRYFAPLQPLHIAYIILAGLMGLIGTYEWKGRKVK